MLESDGEKQRHEYPGEHLEKAIGNLKGYKREYVKENVT